jgi:hypothetical protein
VNNHVFRQRALGAVVGSRTMTRLARRSSLGRLVGTGPSAGTSAPPAESRPARTRTQRTTDTQGGDDGPPAHATTSTQSVNATVPPQPENGLGSRFASKPSETPIQRLA